MDNFQYVDEDRISFQFKEIKKIVTIFIFTLLTFAVIYTAFFLMITVEPALYDYAGDAMSPVPKFFFPEEKTFDIFKKTGGLFLIASTPLMLFNMFLTALGNWLRKLAKFNQNAKIKAEIKRTEKEIMAQFEKINKFSVAVTLDYKAEKEIPPETRVKLSKTIYSKLLGILGISKGEAHNLNNEAFIITSKDFDGYDNVYDYVLNILKKTSVSLYNTYKIIVVPTIMTDAYESEISLPEIKQRLFEVKALNFKNKSCSTLLFRKKYMYMNKSKFQGVPIGQYIYAHNDRKETYYDLNIITQNLVRTLNPNV